jgi:hypothetical protein
LGQNCMTALPDISKHLPTKEGFCRPDWAAIAACIEDGVPESEWRLGMGERLTTVGGAALL